MDCMYSFVSGYIYSVVCVRFIYVWYVVLTLILLAVTHCMVVSSF